MSSAANTVVGQFQQIVSGDGGRLELLSEADGVMSVRYAPGHNDKCATCVLEPDDLQIMLLEAVQQHDPSIKSVSLVVETAAG
jgi:hypothetical protein